MAAAAQMLIWNADVAMTELVDWIVLPSRWKDRDGNEFTTVSLGFLDAREVRNGIEDMKSGVVKQMITAT
jgi:hypothetical protein